MAVGDQLLGERRADKAAGPGDEHAHGKSPQKSGWETPLADRDILLKT
jgi:hypothetical protein